MSLFITSLNSGSNGNCYYIGNRDEAVLIDAGISCKETEIRMQRLDLQLSKVKAIFISHEHSDHIKGVALLSKKYQIPVYITEQTHRQTRMKFEKNLFHRFRANEAVQIGNLSIMPFKKFHDAVDPHSFTIASASVTVGVFTDIGIVCDQIIHHFKQCHAVFLEANYDVEMLSNGNYPIYLKQRITNGTGHISNEQAMELFNIHRSSHLTHLFLSHLSKNNNTPELALDTFKKYAHQTEIIIASRFKEIPIHQIGPIGRPYSLKIKKHQFQLSLF